MGCNNSTAAGASNPEQRVSVERHPSDFFLDEIEFSKIGIPSFDDSFKKAEDLLNKVAGWNNTVNGRINAIQDAVADIAGAYRVSIVEGKDGDIVVVALGKVDGAPLTPEDVAKLRLPTAFAVNEADKALAGALVAINQAYATGIKVVDNVVTCEAKAALADALNKAVTTFKTETGLAVTLSVKPAVEPGATVPCVFLTKGVYADPDDLQPTHSPVTPLDIYEKASAADLLSIWAAVIQQVRAVAKANKSLSATFKMKGVRVFAETAAGDKETKAGLTKAVSNLNIQIFKLHLAALNVNGELGLVKAIAMIVDALIKKVKKLANNSVKDALVIKPKVVIKEDFSVEFDMGVTINIPGVPQFPDCLPTAAKKAYDLVLQTKDKITELAPQFPACEDEIKKLFAKAKEMVEKAPEAATEAGLDMMSGMKAAKNTAMNVKELQLCEAFPRTYLSTLKKFGEELQKTQAEIEIMYNASLQ